jgi:hypothetical protein
MASTPDPWLYCLLEEAASPEHASSLKQRFSELQMAADKSIGSAEKTRTELISHRGEPIIWVVPVGKKKVAFLHSFYCGEAGDEDEFAGLLGFAQSAAPKIVKSGDLSASLVGNSLANRTAATPLPSLGQFLTVAAVGELSLLVGSSSRLVSDLKENSVITFFRPAMLASASLKVRESADAHQVLFKLIWAVKGHFGKATDQVPDVWARVFERLWVIGNDWTNKVRISRASESDFLDEFLGEKNLKLQRHLHPSLWEPEEGKAKSQASEDSLEGWSQNYEEKKAEEDLRTFRRENKHQANDEFLETDIPTLDEKGRNEERDDGSPPKRKDPQSEEDAGMTRPSKRAKAKARSGDDPDDDEPEDSSSEDSDDDSDGASVGPEAARRRQIRKKKYKRRKRRATARREDGILKLLTSQAKAFDEMAIQTSEKRKEDTAKSSLLVAWTDREKKGFSLISAKNYEVLGHPEYNAFVKEASKDKKAQKSLSQIEDISLEEHWGGMASQSGLIRIFARGVRAVNFLETPDGFSAFICFPRASVREKSTIELEHFYQVLFGNGELSSEKMKSLTKNEWFLPSSRYETLEQLTVTIHLLELLTYKEGVASAGYRFGKTLLEQHGALFDSRQKEDPLFMIKFVHLLDAVFQRFLEKLYRFAEFQDPLVKAKEADMHTFQEKTIESALGNFLSLGHVPPLSLPRSLDKYKKSGGTKGDKTKGDLLVKTPPIKEKGEPAGKGGNAGLTKNPDKVWCVPTGKSFLDFFGKEHVENQRGFVKVNHHKAAHKMFPCLKFHVNGICKAGDVCPFSHLARDKYDPEARATTDAKFDGVYGT